MSIIITSIRNDIKVVYHTIIKDGKTGFSHARLRHCLNDHGCKWNKVHWRLVDGYEISKVIGALDTGQTQRITRTSARIHLGAPVVSLLITCYINLPYSPELLQDFLVKQLFHAESAVCIFWLKTSSFLNTKYTSRFLYRLNLNKRTDCNAWSKRCRDVDLQNPTNNLCSQIQLQGHMIYVIYHASLFITYQNKITPGMVFWFIRYEVCAQADRLKIIC